MNKLNICILDYLKERDIFLKEYKDFYCDEFCQRILRMVFIIVCISEVNQVASGILPRIIDPNKIKILLDLLSYGFPSHRITVLKILQILVRKSPNSVQQGIEAKVKEENLLKEYEFVTNPILNFFLNYAILIRKNIWTHNLTSKF